MSTSLFHVLIVDDYEPWRHFCSKTVQKRAELEVVGYAADGLEAVRAAQQLQPDLILLDIGLPLLNGIEAARRIREVSPKSRILCVTEHRSRDIAEEALRVGATGYVIKSQGGGELLRAIRTVLKGQLFISAGLELDEAASSLGKGGPRRAEVPKVVASVLPPRTKTRRNRHEVTFYSGDGALLDSVTRFIGNALQAGNAAVVIATESHRRDLLSELEAFGVNMSAAIEEGRYFAIDAANAISNFVTDGRFEAPGLVALLNGLIATAAKAAAPEHPRVVVFGEGSYILWKEGFVEAAIQDEKISTQLIENYELTESYEVHILCGYSLGSFQDRDVHVFEQICREHSAVHSG